MLLRKPSMVLVNPVSSFFVSAAGTPAALPAATLWASAVW